MEQRAIDKDKENGSCAGIREMKMHWEDVTIPTLVYLAILSQANWKVIPRYWIILVVGYLLFNLYAYVISTFSEQGAGYLKFFLPYAFLPVVWKVLKMEFVQPMFSLYVMFLISVLYEYVLSEKPNFLLALVRLAVVNIVVWGMNRCLISTWSLF